MDLLIVLNMRSLTPCAQYFQGALQSVFFDQMGAPFGITGVGRIEPVTGPIDFKPEDRGPSGALQIEFHLWNERLDRVHFA